jgi:hypothetical protein
MTLFNPSIFQFYFCIKILECVFRSFSSLNSSKTSENTFRSLCSRQKNFKKHILKFKTKDKYGNPGGGERVIGCGKRKFPTFVPPPSNGTSPYGNSGYTFLRSHPQISILLFFLCCCCCLHLLCFVGALLLVHALYHLFP